MSVRRGYGHRGRRQSGPANVSGHGGWPAPWGPHCYLRQGKHLAPYSKTDAGAARRAERKCREQERAALLEHGTTEEN